MKLAKLEPYDIVNGAGIGFTVWFQGCPFHCFNCHNPSTWDFNGGFEIENEKVFNLISQELSKNHYSHISLLGGEPLCKENRTDAYSICKYTKNNFPSKKIYIWTGYEYSDLLNKKDDSIFGIFNIADYLIAGPYIDSQRNITLPLRGSNNQYIINLKTGKDVTNDFERASRILQE